MFWKIFNHFIRINVRLIGKKERLNETERKVGK